MNSDTVTPTAISVDFVHDAMRAEAQGSSVLDML
jgi:hypothetical protein